MASEYSFIAISTCDVKGAFVDVNDWEIDFDYKY